MKQNPKDNSSRRKFLSFGLLSGAALITQPAEAMSSLADEDEKVTMMTADGKLVEVSKKILGQASTGDKARNADVLNWSDSVYKNSK
jgi:hypothetical protein